MSSSTPPVILLTLLYKEFFPLYEHLHMVNTFGLIKAVSDTIFDMIVTTYHDKPLIFSGATFRERSLSHHGAMRNVVSSISKQRSDSCTWYLPFSMLLTTQRTGRMAERSKLLVPGNSHHGVGSSPTPVSLLTFQYKVLFHVFSTLAYCIF